MATVFFITLTFFFSLTCLRLSESLDAQPQSTSIGGDPTSSFKVPLDLFVWVPRPSTVRMPVHVPQWMLSALSLGLSVPHSEILSMHAPSPCMHAA